MSYCGLRAILDVASSIGSQASLNMALGQSEPQSLFQQPIRSWESWITTEDKLRYSKLSAELHQHSICP